MRRRPMNPRVGFSVDIFAFCPKNIPSIFFHKCYHIFFGVLDTLYNYNIQKLGIRHIFILEQINCRVSCIK